MSNLFFGRDWTILNVQDTTEWTVIEAEYNKHPDHCIKCGVVGKLYRHGTKAIYVVDIPFRKLPTSIRLMQRRYKCRSCEKTFIQPNADIDPKRRITKRCVEFIKSQALLQKYTRIADSLGIDEKTIRLIVK